MAASALAKVMSWVTIAKDMPLEFRLYMSEIVLDMATIPMPKGVGPSTSFGELVCPTHLPMPNSIPPYPELPPNWNSSASYGLTSSELAKLPLLKKDMQSLSVWLLADTLDNNTLPPVVGASQEAYMKVWPMWCLVLARC